MSRHDSYAIREALRKARETEHKEAVDKALDYISEIDCALAESERMISAYRTVVKDMVR